MVRKILVSCCFWVWGVSGSHAGQPISESMAECGALLTVAAEMVQTTSRKNRLRNAAAVWAEAAESQARAEGWPNPHQYVSVLWGEKCADWSGKGALYVFSQDFRDWTSYCRALGTSRGLDLNPE